jgi:hypothetical protein
MEKSKVLSAWFILVLAVGIFAFSFVFFGGDISGSVVSADSISFSNNGSNVKVFSANELAKNTDAIKIDKNPASVNTENLSNEVISKRTYTSRTFKNPDGSFTAEINNVDIFFFDGNEFVDLNKISIPQISKKDIILNKTPENNLIYFGNYNLHKGIKVSLENYNLIIRDANKKILKQFPRPFSVDSRGNREMNEFVIKQNGSNLSLYVDVDKNWLANAKYPVTVDPAYNLTNNTGLYQGFAQQQNYNAYTKTDIYDTSTFQWLFIGNGTFSWGGMYYYFQWPFLEFNTSIINDSVTISNVVLNLSYSNVVYPNGSSTFNVTRFNNTRISNSTIYPDTDAGNHKLFDDISNVGSSVGGGFYSSNILFNMTYECHTEYDVDDNPITVCTEWYNNVSVDLGSSADSDLKAQLTKDYFSVGLVTNNNSKDCGNLITGCYFHSGIYDPEGSPKLFVTYSTGGACTYSGSGDWTINETCNIVGQAVTMTGNLIIQDVGLLNITGGTNITFSGANRYIYVYKGGQIFIYTKSGFDSA